MSVISDEYAAEIVGKMRAEIERQDETTADVPPDPRTLLIIKLYDDLQALTKATAFLGGGIPPVKRAEG